jgi:Tol biopolymer transport system component
VKVLDFGLAKALDAGRGLAGPASVSQAPTLTSPALVTGAGMILGTAAYMAPEQAKGRAADRRSDVWSFGVVLYEMLTGRRAFEGEDIADVLGAVTRLEPDWTRLPGGLPPLVEIFLRQCLVKDPRHRLHSLGDMRLALDGSMVARPTSAGRANRRWVAPTLAAAVAALVVAAAGAFSRPSASVDPSPLRRSFYALTSRTVLPSSSGTLVALSSDGRSLVYRAQQDGVYRLFLRSLDQVGGESLPGTDNVSEGFAFSPDGKSLLVQMASSLMRMALPSGRPLRVADLPDRPRGIDWAVDGSIVVGLRGSGLWRRPPEGQGDGAIITKPSDGREYWYPQTLPGGTKVLFTATQPAPDAGDLLVFDLESGTVRMVVESAVGGVFVPTGHVVFVRGGDLWAMRFDVGTFETVGSPVVIETGIRVEAGGAVQIALSSNGPLAYVPGEVSSGGRQLVWVDREGRETPVGAPARRYRTPRVSPDGARIVDSITEAGLDLWAWDVSQRTLNRLTFDSSTERYPTWTTDGLRVIYTSDRSGAANIYRLMADGSGGPERLTESVLQQWPGTVTPDGRGLVFRETTQSGSDLFLLPLSPIGPKVPIVQTRFNERNGEVSPTGRWLAYDSNESGREEVYVRPWPEVGAGRWQVSTSGGRTPVWSRDGRELFYLAPDQAVMGIGAPSEAPWRPASPRRLFDGYWQLPGDLRGFDVAPDGRFLMIKGSDEDGQGIVIVDNWTELLRRASPAN